MLILRGLEAFECFKIGTLEDSRRNIGACSKRTHCRLSPALSTLPHSIASMFEIQDREDVAKQNNEEGHHERDAAKPREHQSAVAFAGRRRLNPNDVVKSSEYLCEESDHDASVLITHGHQN